MIIAEHGEARAVIVLPGRPSKVEAFAAEELQRYIEKITGTRIPVSSDETLHDGQMILIGGPKRNALTARLIHPDEFQKQVPGPEGMMIASFGEDKLVLAGSCGHELERDRGTLYAVYELLERFWGCSFAAYGYPGTQIGETVPKTDTLKLGQVFYKKEKGDLWYRGAVVQFDAFEVNSLPRHPLTPSLIDWLGKNRVNRVMLMLTSYEDIKKSSLYEEFVKRGICMTVGHHDSGMFFLPPYGNDFFSEEYYVTHPEYYRLQEDQSRLEPSSKWHEQLIFDMRNEDAIGQIADNIGAWIQENPYVDIINFWPNDDVAPACCCEACRQWGKNENYTWMVNEIARRVRKTHPHVQLDLLVYQDIWEAPQNVEFEENLLVDVATWGPDGIRKLGCNDGSGLIGSPTEKNALQWAKFTKNLVYYDYYMTNFGSNQVYCPMADEIIQIYEHFVKTGYCKGTATQMESYNLWNYLFNFYVHGRKGYDVSLTYDNLLDRFVRIFGHGAPFVKEYLDYVENFSNGQGSNGNQCAAYFGAHVDTEKVYGLFEKAYEALGEGEYRDNLRLLRMAFRYSDLWTNSPEADEITYISNEFGSFWGELGQIGYGISSYAKPGKTDFVPDKWYQFSCRR